MRTKLTNLKEFGITMFKLIFTIENAHVIILIAAFTISEVGQCLEDVTARIASSTLPHLCPAPQKEKPVKSNR